MLQIFDYQGSPVTFRRQDGSLMINATEMAKPFGKKRVNNWLRRKSTSEFISTLCKLHCRNPLDYLVVTEKGGDGTWLQEDLALEFASLLSPTLAIWCKDRIIELNKKGLTHTQLPASYGETLMLAGKLALKAEAQQHQLAEKASKIQQ